MNIMLVSVTERTREIGLRMAVGAAPRRILWQFLAEAVALCLLGGAFGVLVGWTCSFLVRTLLHWPTEISPPAIVAAVGVSVTVGLVFGFYPAWKASRLEALVSAHLADLHRSPPAARSSYGRRPVARHPAAGPESPDDRNLPVSGGVSSIRSG
jgi:hypothetical protein